MRHATFRVLPSPSILMLVVAHNGRNRADRSGLFFHHEFGGVRLYPDDATQKRQVRPAFTPAHETRRHRSFAHAGVERGTGTESNTHTHWLFLSADAGRLRSS